MRKIKPESGALVVLLGALTMITALAIDMSLPALPTLARDFAATPDQVQLTLSLFVMGFALGQLVFGPVSDRFGRRPVLLIGLALYAAAALACAFSTSIGMLVAARVVQGFASCSGSVLGRAVVRDHFGGDRAAQMFSSLTAVFAAAPLLAPVIGGWFVVHLGWQAIFGFHAIWALALLATTWIGLGESLKLRDGQAIHLPRMLANARTFLSNPICAGNALVNGLCWAGIFAFLSGSPFIFIELYGISPDHFGYYFGLGALALIAGALTNKRLLRRHHYKRVLKLGFAVVLAGGLLVFVTCLTGWGGVLAIMLSFVVYIFGQALVMPNALAAAMEPVPRMAGMAAGLMGMIQMGCGGIAGYAVNALYDGTALPMGGVILAMAIGTPGIYWAVLRRRAA
ncbi:MAG TPA: Bcr/CflA family multidrug efflux MFS transporter [Stellaceae bacterium]|nr:Bcr/CflA family multidrug efflux MFS transporter [Stellaceae bacterium]